MAQCRAPPTRQCDHVDSYHGVSVADPYRWLEDDNSVETAEWVRAQNDVTNSYLDEIKERPRLLKRLTALYDYEKFLVFVPCLDGPKPVYFYRHNTGLQNQFVLWVTENLEERGRVLLDPNAMCAEGKLSVASWQPTNDGRLVAYGISESGSDWLRLKVRDVATGEDLDDEVRWAKATRCSWNKSGSGFYYSRFPEPAEGDTLKGINQGHMVYFHVLGTPQSADTLVYERRDQKEWYLSAGETEDHQWLLVYASKGTDPNTSIFVRRLTPAADAAAAPDTAVPDATVNAAAVVNAVADTGADAAPSAPTSAPLAFEPLLDRMDASYSVVGSDGDTFFVLTNLDAPRFRLVSLRYGHSRPEDMLEIIPQSSQHDVLEGVSLVGDQFVAEWLVDAHSVVRRYSLTGELLGEIQLPGIGSVSGFGGERHWRQVFYVFHSFVSPSIIYQYDFDTNESKIMRRPALKFNPDCFQVDQVFYKSKDGTRVPMFLLHRKGIQLDGCNPTLLYGYGGFRISMLPGFGTSYILWMEMGGVYAIANIRGGGEYGTEWYEQGRLVKKQNVFDDFAAGAEWLIENKYTSPNRLAINGGSNGGLLVGAIVNQRPELFRAAVAEVGVMDMLRFHVHTLGWGWKSDYGSSETREGFDTLMAYSPLHNIKQGLPNYPAVLITTGDHDDRVVPAHSHKYTATMQAAASDKSKPVLTRIEVDAGHGAGTPVNKILACRTDVMAFVMHELAFTLPDSFPV